MESLIGSGDKLLSHVLLLSSPPPAFLSIFLYLSVYFQVVFYCICSQSSVFVTVSPARIMVHVWIKAIHLCADVCITL